MLQALRAGSEGDAEGPAVGAIGARTARQLAQAGIRVNWVPEQGFTSEDFLALPALQSLPNRRILIVRGQGGRELLQARLQQRGAVVDYREVYRRRCPSIDINQLTQQHRKEPFDMIMLTSGESLQNLLQASGAPDWLLGIPVLAGSRRIAAAAGQAGFLTVLAAGDPSDSAMLAALQRWQAGRNKHHD